MPKMLELDPKFASAYARLAKSYIWMDPSGRQMLEKARSAAEKALALNGELDDGHLEVAWTKAVLERDWSGQREITGTRCD